MLLPLWFGLLVVGSFGLTLAAGGGPVAHGSASAAVAPAAPHPAAPHGDLVVTAANSPFVISPATTGASVYTQQGNITVRAGGTLLVKDETIDFVQFVSDTGVLAGRVSHLYHFNVQGSVTLTNSAVTTDTGVINAFPKLTMNVSSGGTVTLVASALEFPGWVSVFGAGSSLTLNQSAVTYNPSIPKLVENESLLGDTVYAPTLSVGGGAHLSLFNSSVAHVYKDNITANGLPGPIALESFASYQLTSGSGMTFPSFSVPTDSENVTRAVLYPSFAGGTVALYYATNNSATSSGSTFSFGGTTYPLPNINFLPGVGVAEVALPAAAMTAINAAGPLGWLEATGSFDQASTISLHLGPIGSANAVAVDDTQIFLTPVLSYNISVTGAGSVVTAADSSLDLNWNLTPGTPVSAGVLPPTWWGSNKLNVDTGAAAYLASVSIPSGRGHVFFAASAVIPDATSNAYFYRWAAIPIVSGASVPIGEAQATAFYSYDASQSNNATATALNDLASADSSLAGYVAAWDVTHGILGYGQSGPNGVAYLLLAASALDQATLPDGTFLGGYHVVVNLPGGGSGATQWGFVSVTPYPLNMTPAQPDVQNPFVYANYAPALAFGSTTVIVANQPQTNISVDIGQAITFSATVSNVGTGPVQSFTVNLSYLLPAPFAPMLVAPTQSFGPLAAGAQQTVDLTWIVNESIVGTNGFFTGQFLLQASWNGGIAPNGGVTSQTVSARIGPAAITLSFVPPSGPLSVGPEYVGNGNVTFNGSGRAEINVTATAPDGSQWVVGQLFTKSGTFQISVIIASNMPSGSYTVVANATYNDRSAVVTVKNAFSIPAPPGASTPFWEQKLLGLPILYWILIAVAIVGGVLGFLFLARRTARGKLVECGECGALIPETATQCPQCGAEFESDLVRCSRCGSTIPADSKVCPECAAQLLGAPEEEARDPERQGYADLVERFRGESKKDLGDNYSEGAFWDWWKRQPTYLSFSQWRLQQSQGSRTGAAAPPPGRSEDTGPAPASTPPRRGGGGGAAPAARGAPTTRPAPAVRPPSRPAAPPPAAAPPAAAPPVAPAAAPSGAGPAMKACSNCGKEIPPDYLVCPFCGAVTQ